MNPETQLDVNIIVDDILNKYTILLKESAMKSAHVAQVQAENKSLKEKLTAFTSEQKDG